MKTEYQTPKTVAEIASVFLSLTPVHDPMLKTRLAFWTERFGNQPLAELSPYARLITEASPSCP